MKQKFFECFVLFLFFTSIVHTQTKEPLWKAVLAGENKCRPVFYQGLLYTFSDDQAISCINAEGSFLWRRRIEKIVNPFLSISPAGFLLLTDASGIVQAFSTQGTPLWTVNISAPLLYEPYSAQDGRIYLVTESLLFCVSLKGSIKWQHELSAPPVRQVLETGNASILLELADNTLLTVTHTGEILERKSLQHRIITMTDAPDGCVISTADGSLMYYLTAPYKTMVWHRQEKQPLLMQHTDKKLLCVYDDGIISLRNIETNTILWTIQLESPLSQPIVCQRYDNMYALVTNGFAAAFTDTGMTIWQEKTSLQPFLPLITSNGMLITMQDWVVTSYSVMIEMNTEVYIQKDIQPLYGIIKLQKEMNKQILPFYFQYNNADTFLARTKNAIEQHTVQYKEAEYAVLLNTILQNKTKSAYFSHSFNVHQRSYAADLLGKLESLEYRAVLLKEAQKASNTVIGIGIIRGLGNIACDPDGRSVDAIQLLLQRYGTGTPTMGWVACDALAEIMKYGTSETVVKAVKTLLSISSGPFTENIRKYARQKIKFIIH